MRKTPFQVILVAVIVFANAAAQTPPKPQQTVPRNRLGVRVVPRSNAAPAEVGTTRPYSQINFDWQYTPNVPACTESLTNCYTGFTLMNTTLGTVVATPSILGPTSLSFSYIPAGGVPYGTSAFSLVANGFDGSGNPLTSTPTTASVVVNVTALNGPTGLTGKAQ